MVRIGNDPIKSAKQCLREKITIDNGDLLIDCAQNILIRNIHFMNMISNTNILSVTVKIKNQQ